MLDQRELGPDANPRELPDLLALDTNDGPIRHESWHMTH
jgi:hypothetical protein